MSTMREHSKKTWTANDTLGHINAGSLQRIADAAEAMAKRHTELITARDWYESAYRETSAREKHLKRRLAAAHGQITKLRNKAKGEL